MIGFTKKQYIGYSIWMMGTGILTGIGLQESIDILLLRQGTVGGEILFLPLILLLYISGFWSAKFFLDGKAQQSYQKGLRVGESQGIAKGVALVEAFKKVYGGKEHGEGNDHFKKAV